MSLYSHTLRGQESEAIENLPDLTLPSKSKQKATGTDGTNADVAYKPAYKKLAKTADFGCNPLATMGSVNSEEIVSNTTQMGDGKSLKVAGLGARKEPMSSINKGSDTIGRWGIRTHDPLIKSQLLYQLS